MQITRGDLRWNESQKLSTNVKRNKNVKLQDINGEYGKKRNFKKT